MAAYAAAARARRAADPEKYRERDRIRQRSPERRAQKNASNARNAERINAYNQAYYAAQPQKFRGLVDAWRAANPERVAAHRAVEKALRRGELARPDACAECGKACKPDAAHTDYDRPLDVRWLCRRCHMLMDKDPERRGDDQASRSA